MTTEAGQSLLIGRLSADAEFARQAGFALFVLVHLETTGLVPGLLTARDDGARLPLDHVPDRVAEVQRANPHLLAAFADPARRAALADVDPAASAELVGWLRGQHLEREELQVAYELGMLALGIELPPILVGALRDLRLAPESRVAELPDGAGYAAVFLSTLHPEWRAAGHMRLYVESTDAAQLAGWAMLLLAGTLAPPAESIVRVAREGRLPFSSAEFDVALVYNPVPWLRAPQAYGAAVHARQVVLL